MKRLNIKLVVALVIVTITVFVGAFFAHALQYRSAAESARQEADALLKDGKRKEALKHYVLYIRQKETNVDPKVLADAAQLAKSVAFDDPTNETVAQANQLLHMAMRQMPDDPQIRQAYAEFMMKFGRFEDAIEPLVWLTAPERGKHDPKLDMMLVECYVRRSYFDKAVDICNALIGFNFKDYKFDVKKA
jgi:predicted Zn-dependent protease